MKQKLEKLQIGTDDLKLQIQERFMNFKKAEQDFLELLSKIKDEEQLLEVMTNLQELDSRVSIQKVKLKQQPSYIG